MIAAEALEKKDDSMIGEFRSTFLLFWYVLVMLRLSSEFTSQGAEEFS